MSIPFNAVNPVGALPGVSPVIDIVVVTSADRFNVTADSVKLKSAVVFAVKSCTSKSRLFIVLLMFITTWFLPSGRVSWQLFISSVPPLNVILPSAISTLLFMHFAAPVIVQ